MTSAAWSSSHAPTGTATASRSQRRTGRGISFHMPLLPM